jgi:hypothetical protein
MILFPLLKNRVHEVPSKALKVPALLAGNLSGRIDSVKYCNVPPGDGDPMADAYNLVVCAYIAMHTPAVSATAQRMARQIERRIDDWEVVGGYMAVLAAQLASNCPPETLEQIRLAVEADNLIPA